MKTKSRTPAEETSPTGDISELLTQIDFSTDNVVAAAAGNPRLFVRAVDFRVQAMRKRSAVKMAWEKAQAEADLDIRANARQSGEKITERYIEEQVLLDPTVSRLAKAFSQADELEEYSKLIVEAFRMRRDCLRIVGDLAREELSLAGAVEAGTERLGALRQKARERFPGA
jgi:hypothetical protein